MRTSNDWPQAPSDSHACPPLLLLDLHLKLFPVMYRIKINDDDDDVERTSCSRMSGWHIRDKLWPMPKHGSVLFYVHKNRKAHLDEKPRMATSTFTWLLNSDDWIKIHVQIQVMTESRSRSRSRLWLNQDPCPDPGYDWIKIQVQIQVMTESRSSSRSRLSAAGTWICESAVPTYGNCVTGLLPIKAHAI